MRTYLSEIGRRGGRKSRSMMDSWELLRETGAAARQMLLDEAADSWRIDKAYLTTDDGWVVHSDGKQRLSYAALAAGAAQPGNLNSGRGRPASHRNL